MVKETEHQLSTIERTPAQRRALRYLKKTAGKANEKLLAVRRNWGEGCERDQVSHIRGVAQF
jgi:hypothetical protein